MNRILLCLALIVALLGTQCLSLHAHLPHAGDAHGLASHHNVHVHSHAIAPDIDSEPEHADAVSIDLLTSTLSRDNATPSLSFTLQAVLILALIVAWICVDRTAPSRPFIYFSPSRLRTPSPRAPPR